MILIHIFTRSGKLAGFQLTNHKSPENSGDSLVLAAVSSAAYMVANMVTDVLRLHPQTFLSKEDGILLQIHKDEQIQCQSILEGFKLHLLEIQMEHPEEILVSYTEVR